MGFPSDQNYYLLAFFLKLMVRGGSGVNIYLLNKNRA